MKLKIRIGLGFAIVLGLLLLVVLLGELALRRTETGIKNYKTLVEETSIASLLQADMLLNRINVKDYLLTNKEEELEEFTQVMSRVKEHLQKAKISITHEDRAQYIAESEQLILDYEVTYQQVVDVIETRNDVSANVIYEQGTVMTTRIAAIIGAAEKKRDVQLKSLASVVQNKLLLGRLYVQKFLDSGDLGQFEFAYKQIGKDLNSYVFALERALTDDSNRTLLTEFKGAHNAYLLAMTQVSELISQRNQLVFNVLDKLGLEVAGHMEAIKHSVLKEQEQLGEALYEKTNQSIYYSVFIAILALSLGVICAFTLTVSITRPITSAVAAADELSKGNLTVSVPQGGRDETGLLMSSIQRTSEQLRTMMGTINEASTELSHSADSLSQVTELTNTGIAEQEVETDLVATAMNEMTTTVSDVANNASLAADAAKKADMESRQGREVVEEAVESINILAEKVNETASTLDEVERESENIGTILDVIRGIAEQTNLLALNAAIEAARAGEKGRGFAVVADEVRSLAQRTQNSTSEIQSLIEELQRQTKNAVEIMNEGREQVQVSVCHAHQAGNALTAINEAIVVINDMNLQIASAAEQQATVAESINENVINVKRIAHENSTAASQTQSSGREIAQLASQLQMMVGEFKI